MPEYKGRLLTRREQHEDLCREALSRVLFISAKVCSDEPMSLVDVNYYVSRLMRWERILASVRRLLGASTEIHLPVLNVHGPVLFAEPTEAAA